MGKTAKKEFFGMGIWGLGLSAIFLVFIGLIVMSYFAMNGSSKVPSDFDVKGKWAGSVFVREAVPGQECFYNGSVQLGLSKEGNLVYGVLFVDEIRAESAPGYSRSPTACPVPQNPPSLTFEVNGTFSLPSLMLRSGDLGFVGYAVSNDSMVLRPDGCVINYGNPGCRTSSLGSGEARLYRSS